MGNILIATGFLVVLGRGWLILLGVPLILFIYSAIVSAEEEYLSRKFGGLYADYRERVNCWLPDWTGLRESLAPMRFNWQRVLVKEYNTIFAVLAALLLIQTWTRVGEEGMSERQWVWVIVSACGLLAGYLSIRLVKKQRWIRG